MTRLRTATSFLALFALAACATDQSAPTGASRATTPALALIGAPDLNDRQSFEGDLFVCKEGTPTGINFNFTYTVVDAGGTTVSSGGVIVPSGSCVKAADVTPLPEGNYLASVTELGPPTGWTLASITHAYAVGVNVTWTITNAPPTISGLRINNDFGVVTTFTNTFSSEGCTLTQGYWKNHEEDWDTAADGHPFTAGSTFYNSGKTYLQILLTPPSGGNAYLQLAHQFIAARLNTDGSPSGSAAVDAALAGAAAYFAAAPAGIPSPTGALRTQLQGWATTLDNYNNGRLGTPHCEGE